MRAYREPEGRGHSWLVKLEDGIASTDRETANLGILERTRRIEAGRDEFEKEHNDA